MAVVLRRGVAGELRGAGRGGVRGANAVRKVGPTVEGWYADWKPGMNEWVCLSERKKTTKQVRFHVEDGYEVIITTHLDWRNNMPQFGMGPGTRNITSNTIRV